MLPALYKYQEYTAYGYKMMFAATTTATAPTVAGCRGKF